MEINNSLTFKYSFINLRNLIYLVITLVMTLFIVFPAFSGGFKQLESFMKQVNTAQGNFVQEQVEMETSKKLGSNQALKGKFLFSRPRRFIWYYEEPYEQLLQSDGKILYIYDKDINQVIERDLYGVLENSPVAILLNVSNIEENFNVKETSPVDGIERVELIPNSKDSQFESIIIGFKQGTIQNMELKDIFGNITLLTFFNVKYNDFLDINKFKFALPKGADIIENY